MSAAAAAVAEILERGGDADDVLREIVVALAAEPDVDWVGLAFVEEGALRLGPSAGREDERRRVRTTVSFQGSTVGELQIDGAVPEDELDRIASLIAPLVLIGWDTGGVAWEP